MTIDYAIDKFALFNRIGYTPHESQISVHASTALRRVAVWGTRAGKTTCAAGEAVNGSFNTDVANRVVRGWCVAPTLGLADKVFREVHLTYMTHLRPFVIRASEHERVIVVRNAAGGISEITAKTAENPVSLLGEGLDWCIVDEAAQLKPSIWERYLSARLIDKQGWAMLISTPKGKGWFYDAYRRGQSGDERWESWRLPTSANPHISAVELAALKAITPELIWKQEYEAEFIEGSGAVFRHVRDRATADWAEPVPDEQYFAGLDLAKTEDFTVPLIIDSKRRVVKMDRFHRIDWELQVARVKTLTDRYNEALTLVDSTGLGEPIFELLCKAGLRVQGYKLTNASKADLINNLAVMLEQGKLTLPREDLAPVLIDELESFQYTVTEKGLITSGAPMGQHDDTVIALALAAWQVRREPIDWTAEWV